MEALLKTLTLLWKGAGTTLEIFFLTLLLALPLGFLVAFGRMSKIKPVSAVFKLYIRIMRGTPLLLQIVFIYFAPFQADIKIDRFMAVIIAFTLNYAAYFAEIYRGGIESIPGGQTEAGEVLGMTRAQIFLRVILPQVIKRILPALSNEVITLIKDTALSQVVGVGELFRAAQNETNRTFTIEPLFYAGVFYFVLCYAVEKAFHFTEKKLGYYK